MTIEIDVNQPVIVKTPIPIAVLEAVFIKLRQEGTAVIMLSQRERHELTDYLFGLEERCAWQSHELENAKTAAIEAAATISYLADRLSRFEAALFEERQND